MQATPSFPQLAEKLRRAFKVRWAALLLVAASGAVPGGAVAAGNGKISVTTQPPGATIYVDGQMSGKTPGAVEGLSAGRYFLRLELDGYRAADVVVELAAGQNYESGPIELIANGAPAPHRAEAIPPPAVVSRPVHATPIPAIPIPATPAPRPAVAPILPPAAPAPAPVRATPAPRDVQAPNEAPTTTSQPAATGEDETIVRLVTAHLKSISDGDIDAYLRLCAPKVDLYDEGMQTQETIRKSRQKLKERWPTYAITNVRDLSVRATDKPDVRRAAVTYDWNVSNAKTGKSASGTASDLLDFKLTGSQWLIVRARQNVERTKKR